MRNDVTIVSQHIERVSEQRDGIIPKTYVERLHLEAIPMMGWG
ncbi:hypothetical protein [Bremerella volcania]|nr:hypothetical protein [Bremerella volcania]